MKEIIRIWLKSISFLKNLLDLVETNLGPLNDFLKVDINKFELITGVLVFK